MSVQLPRILVFCTLLAALLSAPALAADAEQTAGGKDFVLAYKLYLAEPYTGTAVDKADHPLVLANAALAEWSASNADGSSGSLELTRINEDFRNGGYECWVEVRIHSSSASLPPDLPQAVSDLKNFGELKTYDAATYELDSKPQLGGKYPPIFIDGQQRDFTSLRPEAQKKLGYWFLIDPNDRGVSYILSRNLEQASLWSPGTVVKAYYSDGPELHFDDSGARLSLAELALPSFEDGVSIYVSAKDKDIPIDPADLLRKDASRRAGYYKQSSYPMNAHGTTFVFTLCSDGADEGIAGLESALADWRAQYPELTSGSELSYLVESGRVDAADHDPQWRVTLWLYDPGMVQSLRQTLTSATGIPSQIVAWNQSTKEWFQHPNSTRPVAVPGIELTYILHKGEPLKSGEKISLDSEGQKVVWPVVESINNWIFSQPDMRPIGGVSLPCGAGSFTNAKGESGLTISLYGAGMTHRAEIEAQMQQFTTNVPTVREAEYYDQGSNPSYPLKVMVSDNQTRLYYNLLPAIRWQYEDRSKLGEVFNPDEIAAARQRQEHIRAAVESWAATQTGMKLSTDRRDELVAGMVRFEASDFGGVPTQCSIVLATQDKKTRQSLLAALEATEGVGAPDMLLPME